MLVSEFPARVSGVMHRRFASFVAESWVPPLAIGVYSLCNSDANALCASAYHVPWLFPGGANPGPIIIAGNLPARRAVAYLRFAACTSGTSQLVVSREQAHPGATYWPVHFFSTEFNFESSSPVVRSDSSNVAAFAPCSVLISG